MEKVTSGDGTTIAFDRLGEGPPLVYVGGALSVRTHPMTTGLTEELARHFTVINYDRRGRGDSGDTLPYAVERECEDLAALIAAAGGSAFAYGLSSGAVLALEAAARGLPITKLALYEPPFIIDDSRPPLPADYVQRITELCAAGRRGDAVEVFMTEALRVPEEFLAGMRDDPMWAGMEQVAHTLAHDGTVMGTTMSGSPLPPDRWSGATMPVLVIDGADSEAYMHDASRALAEILPNARRRTLQGQGHMVAPEAITPVLREFFTGG